MKRKGSEQWYINFPSAVAQAMEFSPGEAVEWIIENKAMLTLRRLDPSSSSFGPSASPPATSAVSPIARNPSP